jgi:uncharacterized membrane protein YgdD (TMEM256/DUF423 family)
VATKAFVFLGSLLAALGVALGAVGAHVLKPHLTPPQLETFHTAVQYQMYHAIGLALVGLLRAHCRSRLLDLAAWAMLAGIVLFSGFLYAWVATGERFFVYPVPFGGLAFIAGWGLAALGALGSWREK